MDNKHNIGNHEHNITKNNQQVVNRTLPYEYMDIPYELQCKYTNTQWYLESDLVNINHTDHLVTMYRSLHVNISKADVNSLSHSLCAKKWLPKMQPNTVHHKSSLFVLLLSVPSVSTVCAELGGMFKFPSITIISSSRGRPCNGCPNPSVLKPGSAVSTLEVFNFSFPLVFFFDAKTHMQIDTYKIYKYKDTPL